MKPNVEVSGAACLYSGAPLDGRVMHLSYALPVVPAQPPLAPELR